MAQPIAPAPSSIPPSQGLPILFLWPIITALGASLFGAIVGVALMAREGDAAVPMLVAMLLGGAIIGWLEWRTLRRDRIAMGFRWVGLTTATMLLLHLAIEQSQINQLWSVLLLPVVWGLILDGSRWWLLRSHFPKAHWWLVFCGLGWVLDGLMFFYLGIWSFATVRPLVGFVAFNGLVHGIWLGLCRGWALTLMLRDRDNPNSAPPLSKL